MPDAALEPFGGRAAIEAWMLDAARATSDFYIDSAAAADGVPYWDTGAPGLAALGAWGERAADPFNDHEPVDSSAAAIAAQGLLRLGHYLNARGEDGARYEQAGLRVLDTLLDDGGPYLSTKSEHQGLLLHAVYHRPNGWDYIPPGAKTMRGESCQWGDYHLREAALCVLRQAKGEPLPRSSARAGRDDVHFQPQPAADRRVAVVTGGTRGIGLGIARALAREGWSLALCGVRPAETVADVLEELRGLGTGVEVSADIADLSRTDDRVRLVESIRARYSAVHALVNNAGRARARGPTSSKRPKRASKR